MTRSPEEILDDAAVPFRVHEHVPVATVAEIVDALPFPAEQHVKMLAFDADGRIVLAALRGSDRLAYGALARAAGVPRDRLRPLTPERVREELGLEPGGVCPLVDHDRATVLVDAQVLDLDRRSRIVFIGRGFTRDGLERSLSAFNRAASAR